ncbi:MAG: hypothetical protein RIR87_1756 [Actinomycetota bacterium]
MSNTRRIGKYVPALISFGFVLAGSWMLIPRDADTADAEARVDVVVLTRGIPKGTSYIDVLNVCIRFTRRHSRWGAGQRTLGRRTTHTELVCSKSGSSGEPRLSGHFRTPAFTTLVRRRANLGQHVGHLCTRRYRCSIGITQCGGARFTTARRSTALGRLGDHHRGAS